MATYEQLMEGARRADQAGDAAGARRFLELAKEAKGQKPVTGADEMRARGLRSPDPTEANAAAAAGIQAAQDEAFVAANPIKSRVQSFNAGLPFIGSRMDEFADAIGPEGAGDLMRTEMDAFSRARPMQDAALRLAGGVTGSVALLPAAGLAGRAAAPLIPAGTGLRTVAGAGAGALAGAAEGAIYGSGIAEGEGRAANARDGAVLGGLVGGAVGAAAPLAARGIESLVGRLRGSDVRTISGTLGISNGAARVVRDALNADDLPAAMQAIDRAGGSAMLADAGPGTRQLLDTVTQAPGAAPRIARDAVDARAEDAGREFASVLDRTFGAPQGRDTSIAALRQGTAASRRQAYDAAYAKPIDYSTKTGRALEDRVRRVPKDILARANRLMEVEGVEPQYLISIQPDGTALIDQMPSVQQIDYITRALNDAAKSGDGAGALGGQTALGRSYQNLSRDLRTLTSRSVPEYRTALNTAADAIRQREAIDLGYEALRPSTTRETVREGLKGATRLERVAARQGVRSYIDDQMANARQILSDPSRTEEITEAIKGLNDLATRSSRDKLTAILGPRQSEDFFRDLDEIRTTFELRAALARNSATASRTATREGIDLVTRPNALQELAQGGVKDATRRIVQTLTGVTPEAQALRQQGIYAEIAEALTSVRGPQARSALRVIERAMTGQPVTDAQARLIARAVTTGGAVGAYQTGMQQTGR